VTAEELDQGCPFET